METLPGIIKNQENGPVSAAGGPPPNAVLGELHPNTITHGCRNGKSQLAEGLMDNTLIIRTSDHGEMGMAHGGMRQKSFNFYEESLRAPLIHSNPNSFRGRKSRRQWSPTSISCRRWRASVMRRNRQGPRGRAPTTRRSCLDPRAPPQNHIVFTFDDYQSGDNPSIASIWPTPLQSTNRKAANSRE